MILLIDNYDSFVYNLARYVGQLGFAYRVVRNDAITLSDIEALQPSHIILSPGPCTPTDAGITLDVIQYFANKIPILGICLGHQAIGQAFGGVVIKAPYPIHGKASFIHHDTGGIFQGIETPFKAARYHSLILSEPTLPDVLQVTARTADGVIMAVKHIEYPIVGLQFHPESVLTQHGYSLLLNFVASHNHPG